MTFFLLAQLVKYPDAFELGNEAIRTILSYRAWSGIEDEGTFPAKKKQEPVGE